jgi:hypothetical protein
MGPVETEVGRVDERWIELALDGVPTFSWQLL